MLTGPWGGGLTSSRCHHTAPLSDGHPQNTIVSQGTVTSQVTVTSQGIVILRLLSIPQGKSPPRHYHPLALSITGHCHSRSLSPSGHCHLQGTLIPQDSVAPMALSPQGLPRPAHRTRSVEAGSSPSFPADMGAPWQARAPALQQ